MLRLRFGVVSSCRIRTRSPVVVRAPPTMMFCSEESSVDAEMSKRTRRMSFPEVVLHKLSVGRTSSAEDEEEEVVTKGRPPTRRMLSDSSGRKVHKLEGDATATGSTKEVEDNVAL